jgi:hypothetical protein
MKNGKNLEKLIYFQFKLSFKKIFLNLKTVFKLIETQYINYKF